MKKLTKRLARAKAEGASMTTPRTITLAYLHCLKCGHTWLPRSAARPSQCPACHSAAFDKERRAKKEIDAK